MYVLYITPQLRKKLKKLKKKNPEQAEMVVKKVEEILIDPYRYKNLRAPFNNLKRVHIDTSFVLTFSIEENTVTLEDFDHHDNIYK
jgi:YafQ family addiction module toxin component